MPIQLVPVTEETLAEAISDRAFLRAKIINDPTVASNERAVAILSGAQPDDTTATDKLERELLATAVAKAIKQEQDGQQEEQEEQQDQQDDMTAANFEKLLDSVRARIAKLDTKPPNAKLRMDIRRLERAQLTLGDKVEAFDGQAEIAAHNFNTVKTELIKGIEAGHMLEKDASLTAAAVAMRADLTGIASTLDNEGKEELEALETDVRLATMRSLIDGINRTSNRGFTIKGKKQINRQQQTKFDLLIAKAFELGFGKFTIENVNDLNNLVTTIFPLQGAGLFDDAVSAAKTAAKTIATRAVSKAAPGLSRLMLLKASRLAGNDSQTMFNEMASIADKLLASGKLTKLQHTDFMSSVV